MKVPLTLAFVPPGLQLSAEGLDAHSIYLGVGGIQHPQVFDHCPEQGDHTPAEMIWSHRDLIAGWGNAEQPMFNKLILPEHPNWNICWAYLLLTEILAGRIPSADQVEIINRFSSLVQRGLNPCKGPIERSVLAVFESIMDDLELEEGQAATELHSAKLMAGSDFIRFCLAHADSYEALQDGRFLESASVYAEYKAKIKEDRLRYLHDLRNGFRFTARLAHRSGRIDWVDGLFLVAPTSRLFKFWARGDLEHTEAGFPLLWVRWQADGWVISVNPASGYTLKGLADLLTRKEVQGHPEARKGPPRPGFDVPNPWYDERDKSHACTIVFSPRGGTRLSSGQVRRLLKSFFKIKQWRRVFSPVFAEWLQGKMQQLVLIASVLGVLGGVVDKFILRHDPVKSCPNWDQIKVGEGRQIAIVIGVSNYQHTDAWAPLQAPVADAVSVWKRLMGHYGYAADKSKLLLSPRPGVDDSVVGDMVYESATRTNIVNALEAVIRDESLTNKDSLLIYFAGHGASDQYKTYLIPEEGAGPKEKTSWVSDKELEPYLKMNGRSSGVFRHVQIILDACRTSTFDLGRVDRKTLPLWDRISQTTGDILDRGAEIVAIETSVDTRNHQRYSLPSRRLLSSGYQEDVPDKLGRGSHSPFASCFLQELDDIPSGGAISMFELRNKTAQCLEAIPTTLLPPEQRPRPHSKPLADDCDGEFFLNKQNP